MANQHLKVSGAWKATTNCSVKVSSAWKQVNNIYSKVSGAWKLVWSAAVVTVTAATSEDTDEGTANVRISTDGNIYVADGASEVQANATTDWVRPTTASSSLYEVKWDFLSGDTPNAGNMAVEGTWYALSIDRTVGLSVGVPILDTCDLTISIRYDGGSVLDSATFTIRAINTT